MHCYMVDSISCFVIPESTNMLSWFEILVSFKLKTGLIMVFLLEGNPQSSWNCFCNVFPKKFFCPSLCLSIRLKKIFRLRLLKFNALFIESRQFYLLIVFEMSILHSLSWYFKTYLNGNSFETRWIMVTKDHLVTEIIGYFLEGFFSCHNKGLLHVFFQLREHP